MSLDEQLKEARVKIEFLEGVIKEITDPSIDAEELDDPPHRAVFLVQKDEWHDFKTACARHRITCTAVFKIAIRAMLALGKQ